MKAISLWQPWATLWVLQIKRFETRHWIPKNDPGDLAIHAAKKLVKIDDPVRKWHIDCALQIAGLTYDDLPRGAIIGKCDGLQFEEITLYNTPPFPEYAYGDFSDGRYKWDPENMVSLPEPIPFKGRQGFFNVPDELIKRV